MPERYGKNFEKSFVSIADALFVTSAFCCPLASDSFGCCSVHKLSVWAKIITKIKVHITLNEIS